MAFYKVAVTVFWAISCNARLFAQSLHVIAVANIKAALND